MNNLKSHYKHIVIGAGAGGLTCSLALITAGEDVLLIEGSAIGGDCTHTGCVPSKALIAYGQQSPGVVLSQALENVRSVRQGFVEDETVEAMQDKYNIDIVMGYAKFVDENHVIVNDQTIKFDKAVIATGSSANIPDIIGLEDVDYLTHENFFELTEDIDKLTIVGGGYIGCEIANACANLGVQVTLVQRNDTIIPHESSEAQQLVHNDLISKGVTIYTSADTQSVQSDSLIIIHNDNKIIIPHDRILIATGKNANIAKLGLDTIELDYNEQGIIVDHRNRTNLKHIFAIGDCVADNPKFTHWADHEGLNVFKYLYRRIIASSSYRQQAMPSAIYTDIQVARVGISINEISDQQKDNYIVIKLGREENDKSVIVQDTDGFMRIIFKRLTGTIMGAEVAGHDTVEILSLLTYLVQHEVSAYKVTSQIFPYPVRSHLIKKICGQFVIQSIQNRKSHAQRWLKANMFKIIAGGLWIAIIISYFVIKSRLGLTTQELGSSTLTWLQGSSYGALLFITIYAVRSLTLFPATIMTLMGGILFGPVWGIIYTLLASIASAMLSYGVGRVLGKGNIPSKTGIISKIKSTMKGDGLLSVVLVRLIPMNYDIVNYSLGILGVRFWPYVFGTALGILPAMVSVVLVGASLQSTESLNLSDISINPLYIGIAIGLYAVTFGITYVIRKYYKI